MGPGSATPSAPRRSSTARWALVATVVLAAGAAMAVARLMARSGDLKLEALYEAHRLFSAGRLDEALAILDRRAAGLVPTPLDWVLRADIAHAQGRFADAIEALEHVPDDDPVRPQTWLKIGQAEFGRHHAGAAESAYRRALALSPELIQAHRELTYLLAIQRRKADCDAQFRALSARVPLDHVLAFAWCQNSCGIWDPKGPRAELSACVAAVPEDRWSRLALATSYLLTQEFDEAERVLAPLPETDLDARAVRVELAMEQGQVEEARELAGAVQDDHPRLNILRGQLALHGSKAEEAARCFRAALRVEPDNRDALRGLGLALQRLGSPEAERFLQFAARQDVLRRMIQDSVTTIKTDPKLFLKLGGACEAIGRADEARAWYQLAIRRDPLDVEAQQALVRLDQHDVQGPPSASASSSG